MAPTTAPTMAPTMAPTTVTPAIRLSLAHLALCLTVGLGARAFAAPVGSAQPAPVAASLDSEAPPDPADDAKADRAKREEMPPADGDDTAAAPAAMPLARNGMRVAISIGGTVINGSPLRDVLQDGSVDEQTFDLDVQPGAFGMRAELNTQESSERHAHVTSNYQSVGLRLAPTYRVFAGDAPLNVLIFLGVMYSRHDIYLDDGIQILESSCAVPGAFGGAEVLFRLMDRFAVQLRLDLSAQKVNFKQFSSKHNLVERSLLIGGGYEF